MGLGLLFCCNREDPSVSVGIRRYPLNLRCKMHGGQNDVWIKLVRIRYALRIYYCGVILSVHDLYDSYVSVLL